ncbi:hypothetical protein TVAG_193420 [Trichomonas vaginalis G3]|uniref:Uncharacterized protein n=1 Tax=Trichomonas vaginalis (strain ATCC PRA-98 / G3) TaxID=412133 RepID=A2DH56_TRIV3|nr:spectrin binding [Trichomonas vaginalis G3]EAY20366.1 hypothetical protein TVAG_193420 [Trichomonas vaginalis G3]KAI5530634.1 spectrin binding [Trichomonas vaginalis G3]|eukprot:XP_001581352.1 hypothetical protein [Trichomonas vaginalis G3]
MFLFLFELSKSEELLFGYLSKDFEKQTLTFGKSEFQNGIYCPAYNYPIECKWNDAIGGPQCNETDYLYSPPVDYDPPKSIIETSDDDCFGYFKKDLSNDPNFIDKTWDEIKFTCKKTHYGRCYFKIYFNNDDGSTNRCKNYVDYRYSQSSVSLNKIDGSQFFCQDTNLTRKIKSIRAYVLPLRLKTVFTKVQVETVRRLILFEKIENYSEDENRKERYPTAFKTNITTKNNKTAYRATIKLYKENPKIQLSTMLLNGAYSISPIIQDNSVPVSGRNDKQLVSPIIANGTHIIGIDVFNTETFFDWSYSDNSLYGSNTSCLYMNIKPIKDVNISYIVIEAETGSYLEALEVWHQAFPDLYGINPYGKSSICKNPNISNWSPFIVTQYGCKLLWGSDEKYEGTKNFYEMNPSIIRIYTNTNKKQTKENYLKDKYGVKDKTLKNIIIEETVNYKDYLVDLADEVIDYQLKKYFRRKLKHEYDGIAISRFDLRYMNYNTEYADKLTPYLLCDEEDKKYYSIQCGMLKLLKLLYGDSPDGFLVESFVVHPQFAQYIGSSLYTLNNYADYLAVNHTNKVGLWNT